MQQSLFKIYFFVLLAPFTLCANSQHSTINAPPYRVAKHFIPQTVNFTGEEIITNPSILLQTAQHAHAYFISNDKENRKFVRSPLLERTLITTPQSEKTLSFVIKTLTKDICTKKNPRLLNPQFLSKNFTFIRWYGEQTPELSSIQKPGSAAIKLTSYAVFKLQGSPHKTETFCYPLYAIKSKQFLNSLRFTFTKQAILQGALDKPWFRKHIYPLVWLTRDGLEEALMQGTAIVEYANGTQRIFNVDKDNNIAYNKTIALRENQSRYWYFKEIKKVEGGEDQLHLRIINCGGVALAGDIDHLGLGKIILLRYTNPLTQRIQMRICILVDQGGAFAHNLSQLDLFAGIFDNRGQFKQFISQFPNTVEAYILKVKEIDSKKGKL